LNVKFSEFDSLYIELGSISYASVEFYHEEEFSEGIA
jgi:hypothetical protein